jgi:phage terminase large subunit-like protein
VAAGKDYIAIAAQYQADVLSGAIPACKWVRLACERNRRDLDRQDTEAFPYRFEPDAGTRVCRFAELLPHIKGPKAFVVGKDDDDRPMWNTIELEPWQCWLLTCLFGWRRQDGLRRFRVALWLLPRKNAKSTIGAVIALYMFAVEGGSGAECYSAATTRDQAKIVAEIAWEMAARAPQFREQFGIRLGSRTTRTLTIPATASKFGPLSADAQSLDGLNVLLAVIDELHAHKTRAVWDVLDTATGTQLEPLLLAITTAGVEIGGICHEKLGYLEKILDGVAVDEAFFGLNFTIDTGDDIRLESVQRKANPNYGVSVQPDDLERKIAEAQHNQSAMNNVLTKHFNVWIRTESGWMSSTLWQGCHVLDLKWEDLKQYPCWIGVDLGEVRDFSAVVLVFKVGPGTFAVVPFIYVPQAGIDQSPIAQMTGWVRQGWIIPTPGNEADYQRIEDDLVAWFDKLDDVQEIDFDKRSARLMMQKLRQRLEPTFGRDKTAQIVLDIPQNSETFDPAMTITAALVAEHRLQHDGNEAMAWMISNVVVDLSRGDEKYPLKAGGKDSANKIDGPVAMWTALRQAMQVPDKEPEPQIFFAGRKR